MTETQKALRAELQRFGVRHVSLEIGGRHPRLVFVWDGRNMFWPFSLNADGRSRRNQIAGLRRMLRRAA